MRQLMMKYTGGKVGTYETDFSIRNYESSDYEQMLDALVPLTLKRYDRHELDSVILLKSGVTPDSVFVAEDNGAIIGTATGYTHEPYGEKPGDDGGTLHMVSALPSASGRGVGYAVCAAAVNWLIGKGCKYVDLTTDDHRLPAIVTYMKLGFRPVIDDDEMRARWQKISETLSDPKIISEAIII